MSSDLLVALLCWLIVKYRTWSCSNRADAFQCRYGLDVRCIVSVGMLAAALNGRCVGEVISIKGKGILTILTNSWW